MTFDFLKRLWSSQRPRFRIPARLPGGLMLGLKLGIVSGLLMGGVDYVDSVTGPYTGDPWLLAAYVLAVSILVFAAAGASVAAWVVASYRLSARLRTSRQAWLRAALVSLPGAAFVLWIPSSWIETHWVNLESSRRALVVVTGALLLLGTLVVSWLANHWYSRCVATSRPGLLSQLSVAIAGALLAAAAYWADRTLFVNLYYDFHVGLMVLCASALAWCSASLRFILRMYRVPKSPRSITSNRLAGAALASALLALLILENASPNIFGPSRSVVFSKLRLGIQAATDWDGDGASSLMGGGDCGPFDAKVAPGGFDMPGNDLDEDCSGSSARWPKSEKTSDYPVPRVAGKSLLVITIDTLRADHLHSYGYARKTSPAIDRFASSGLRFARAFAPAPKTPETFPALMTGLYPSNVPRDYSHERIKRYRTKRKGKSARVQDAWYRIGDEVEVLAEAVHRKGYRTTAFIGGLGMDMLGLERGFDTFKRTTRVTKYARNFLKEQGKSGKARPFFLWLHYNAPHHPYKKHAKYDFGERPIDRYDSEIAFDDQQVGTVLATLKRQGLADDTIVLLTSDHGEEFGDHGGEFHTDRLYRELLHVPLIVRVPGVSPQVVETPVELVDVVPTLCELLKLHASCDHYDGLSLLAAVANRRDPRRGAYAELFRRGGKFSRRALYDGRWKLIQDIEHGRNELYAVDSDPTEQRDVSAQHPDVVENLLDRIATRPLYRQGQVIAQYERTGDRALLAKGLGVLRQEPLLLFALNELDGHTRPEYAPYLRKLSRAQDLSAAITSRARHLYWMSRAAP